MFSKISRYRKVTDEVSVDCRGRRLPSKALREPPDAHGSFLHTVEEGDRLDHLAYKYYKQPRKWWRICDANPEFLLPQALLGKAPMVTARFPFSITSGVEPPWAELFAALRRTVGVEDVQLSDEIRLIADEQNVNGKPVPVTLEQYELALIVTYNRMNVSTACLSKIIGSVSPDLAMTQPETIGRTGKKIVIPPDVIG